MTCFLLQPAKPVVSGTKRGHDDEDGGGARRRKDDADDEREKMLKMVEEEPEVGVHQLTLSSLR